VWISRKENVEPGFGLNLYLSLSLSFFFKSYFHICQLLVAVNKMDATEPPYSKLRYYFIVERLLDFLVNECRFKKEKVRFVPVSAFIGENVTKPPLPTSAMMSGLGQVPFTLLQSIDMFKIPPRPTASPLRVRFCK
jgi:elongation factor 1-alpha